MDLISIRINSLFRLNDASSQGFEWFCWNYLFVGTAELHSYLIEFKPVFSFIGKFFLPNIYLPQIYINHDNDTIHTRKQKWNAND